VGERAKILGALLLAIAEDPNIRIFNDPTRMIEEINSNVSQILSRHGKSSFSDVIKIPKPPTQRNHKFFRKAVVEVLQHLREMNVRSAINSGDDALGKFYETFLKHANGAKEMGIVLTPRHITKFAVEILNVNAKDVVYDPACGTGGFLVSALDHVKKTTNNEKEFEQFLEKSLWGVEN